MQRKHRTAKGREAEKGNVARETLIIFETVKCPVEFRH
jgi:hypothetical protein